MCLQSIFMMTSSNGNIFRVTGSLCGEFTGPGEFPTQRTSNAWLWYFLWSTSKRLSKQPWGWWFETPSWSLWRHGNVHDARRQNIMCPFKVKTIQVKAITISVPMMDVTHVWNNEHLVWCINTYIILTPAFDTPVCYRIGNPFCSNYEFRGELCDARVSSLRYGVYGQTTLLHATGGWYLTESLLQLITWHILP